MMRKLSRLCVPAVTASLISLCAVLGFAQATGAAPKTTTTQTTAANDSSNATANARARRRAARRRARAAQQQPIQQPQAATMVGPTDAQRSRDAQILAAQKKQSAASAQENDALTQKVVQDRQRQQAEPRIQDAPGPGSQPLAGDPAVQPAPVSEPPRIQNAPGPAQTLPTAPQPTPAPPQ